MKNDNASMTDKSEGFPNYTCTKDFRANGYPCDEKGKPLYLSDEMVNYFNYIEWLSDYLFVLNLDPIKEHAKLCQEITTHPIYSTDALRAIDHIAFEFVFGEGRRGRCNKEEREYRKKFWPRKLKKLPADMIYRVPLSIILKKFENHKERTMLLHSYFSQVAEYLNK